MSDLAAGCPDCKKLQSEITMLEERIKQLEAKCGNERRGYTCMLSPKHEGCHRYWDGNTALAWGGG